MKAELGYTIAGILTMTCLTQPVQAGDVKIYAGSSCLPTNYNPQISPNPIVRWNGRASNTSTHDVLWECPIVRDAAGIRIARIYVIDNHPNKNVRCRVGSLSSTASGGVGWVSPIKSSVGASATPQALYFGPLRHYDDHGYYAISCSVPGVSPYAASSVVSYRIDEN